MAITLINQDTIPADRISLARFRPTSTGYRLVEG